MFLLAHIFGADHFWMFVIPAVAALVLLRWAEKRARSRADAARANKDEEPADVD